LYNVCKRVANGYIPPSFKAIQEENGQSLYQWTTKMTVTTLLWYRILQFTKHQICMSDTQEHIVPYFSPTRSSRRWHWLLPLPINKQTHLQLGAAQQATPPLKILELWQALCFKLFAERKLRNTVVPTLYILVILEGPNRSNCVTLKNA